MSDLVERALSFAIEAHRGQLNDDGLPYAMHPVDVANRLRVIGKITDEEMLAAALLHDTLEHSETKPKSLRDEFGARVLMLVEAMTRREPATKQVQGLGKDEVWRLRADMLLEDVEQMDPEAHPIKLADRLSNTVNALECKRGAKLQRYLWQSRRIHGAIPRKANPALWDELKRVLKV